jgi:hypothetical protein
MDFNQSDILIEEDDVVLLSGKKVTYVRREQWDDVQGRRKKQFYVRDNGNYVRNDAVPIEEWPLYGLDSLDSEGPIVVVEGVKAAKSLHRRGTVAVGTFSAQVAPAALEPLYGRDVVLWPDNDEIGVSLMMFVARELSANGTNVRLLKWVGGPYHGDAADFDGDLRDLVATAQPIDPELAIKASSQPTFEPMDIPLSLKARRRLPIDLDRSGR